MTYKVEFSDEALKQLSNLRKGDRNAYLKCFDFVLAISTDPIAGIGKPERLKGFRDLHVYSRKVNDKDRFVYVIYEDKEKIEVISCVGHYLDH